MDKLAAGIMIALAALFMSGGFARDVMAAEPAAGAPEAPRSAQGRMPAVDGLRGDLVVSLVLTLEALRAAPVLLDARKV